MVSGEWTKPTRGKLLTHLFTHHSLLTTHAFDRR
jgi:hypothetical protein